MQLGGEVGGEVPLGGSWPPGRRCRVGKELGGNEQKVEKKASRVLYHQNLVVCLDASMEDTFSGKTEKLLSI